MKLVSVILESDVVYIAIIMISAIVSCIRYFIVQTKSVQQALSGKL